MDDVSGIGSLFGFATESMAKDYSCFAERLPGIVGEGCWPFKKLQ